MNGLRKMASITKKIESIIDTPLPRDRSERITATTFGPAGALAGVLGGVALAFPVSKSKKFKEFAGINNNNKVSKYKRVARAAIPLAAIGVPIGAAIGSAISSGIIRSRRKNLDDTPEEQMTKNKTIYARRGAPMPRKGRVLGY